MPDYIFLDTWVLSDYTREDKQQRLSDLICANNYTILINGISLAELYDPNWQQAEGTDRMSRAARFLSRHSCAVVRPERVIEAEIECFPANIERLPIGFNLDDLPCGARGAVLLRILRRDSALIQEGIDIEQWVEDYNRVKALWLEDVDRIIQHACDSGVLKRNEKGQFVDIERSKEDFLVTLDRRHFSRFNPAMGKTKSLPAVRFSSLCSWYAYVDTDKAYTMKRKGSDIGDLYQMSLIPYCSAFTLDTTMYRLARRVMADGDYPCRLYDRRRLDALLDQRQE